MCVCAFFFSAQELWPQRSWSEDDNEIMCCLRERGGVGDGGRGKGRGDGHALEVAGRVYVSVLPQVTASYIQWLSPHFQAPTLRANVELTEPSSRACCDKVM